MTAAAIEPTATAGRPAGSAPSGLTTAAILIVVGVISTTLAQPQVLARLPLTNMMKNELHIPRAQSAAFFFLCGLPWYFKPLAGVLTDAFPILGSRRKTYLFVSAILATLVWAGIYFTPHRYAPLLWMCLLLSLFMMLASTVIGAFMVEIAQASAASGRLTAIRQAAQMFVTFVNGPAAGYLASIAFGWTAVACGFAMFLIVPVTILLMREQRQRIDSGKVLSGAAQKVGTIVTARVMWAAAAVMVAVYLAPGLGTALFYRQQDLLHMQPNSGPGLPGFLGGQGFLGVLGGIGGISAAAFYAWACRRHDLRTMLALSLVVAGIGGLLFLFYSTAMEARVLALVGGFAGTLPELALMDLAVRATPVGAEGMGFALLMSARNVCALGADWIGSALLDKHMVDYGGLVWITALWTAATAALAFVLPHHLVRRKDAEVLEEYPEPLTAVQE